MKLDCYNVHLQEVATPVMLMLEYDAILGQVKFVTVYTIAVQYNW